MEAFILWYPSGSGSLAPEVYHLCRQPPKRANEPERLIAGQPSPGCLLRDLGFLKRGLRGSVLGYIREIETLNLPTYVTKTDPLRPT